MSDHEALETEETNDEQEPIPWLRATPEDAENLDFEAPVATSVSANARELDDLFFALTKAPDNPDDSLDTPAARVFSLLGSVCGMHFRPENKNEPFAPMFVWADGRRSAALADFRGKPVELLADMARRAINPVLKARFADVCWVLERKLSDLGKVAVESYVEIIERADAGELVFFAEEKGALTHEARDMLRRALYISRSTGWEKEWSLSARKMAICLRDKAVAEQALIPTQWFSDLDLDFGLSSPADVAANLEEVLAGLPADANFHAVTDMWQLAARAYHLANSEEDKHRCMSEAAERMVVEAEGVFAGGSSAVASHWMGMAISQLHGIPGKRDRRTQLRHRLIDMQSGLNEEMQSFSQEIDLREVIENVEKMIEPLSLLDRLFVMSNLCQSPVPEDLVADAKDMLSKHPLSSLFGTSHHDDEGKVIHKTGGGNLDGNNEDSIGQQIAQTESLRRKLAVSGKIEIARQLVVDSHYLSDDNLHWLLRHSVFVPQDTIETYCRGFVRFFQGDFVSATYTLTPLLENSLRHVLKVHGHDVTIFDDATQTQQDRTISSLLEQMRPELEQTFSPPLIADIENVFLAKPGPQLRHAVAHGLLTDNGPYGSDAVYGCWLIFRLCMIPIYGLRDKLEFPFPT